MYFFFGNICMCAMAAFAATLLFESPFIGLEKIIFGRTSSLDKKPLTPTNENHSPNKTQHSQKSGTLDFEKKFQEPNQKHNIELANGAPNFQQNSFRQKCFDDISYES